MHTLYYEDYLRVTDSILGAVLRALAPCVDKPLASYAEPADGMTALHVLGKRGFVLATQTLLDMGAEPDAQYRPEGHTRAPSALRLVSLRACNSVECSCFHHGCIGTRAPPILWRLLKPNRSHDMLKPVKCEHIR